MHLSIALAGRHAQDPTQHLEAGASWLYRTVSLAGVTDAIEVRLAGVAPAKADEYERGLGSRLSFGADRYEVVFDRGLLDLPLAGRRFEGREEPVLKLAADPIEGGRAVHRAILDTLPRNRPTIDRVAQDFGISTRTLQRVLERWGVTFEAILEETRRTQALELIARGEARTNDIAFLLGYADQPHFTRAFRRWTGTTPGAYRRTRSPDAAVHSAQDPAVHTTVS